MRVFVAMEIPEDVRAAVGALITKLQPMCRAARWVRVAGMHVTLKFIGEVPEETVERVKAELRGVRSAAPVDVNFRGVGFFPSAKRPRVFWAGIEASANLAPMAAEIERRLETLGIAREHREFHPHLTLARFESQDGVPQLCEELEKLAPFEFGAVHTGEFHLYRSELKRGGAVYTKLGTFPFVEAAL